MDDLPLPFLLGSPFFKENLKGAIFDLNSNLPSVTFCKTDLKPTLTLASTADNKTTFIFPFANDFTPIINSALNLSVNQLQLFLILNSSSRNSL